MKAYQPYTHSHQPWNLNNSTIHIIYAHIMYIHDIVSQYISTQYTTYGISVRRCLPFVEKVVSLGFSPWSQGNPGYTSSAACRGWGQGKGQVVSDPSCSWRRGWPHSRRGRWQWMHCSSSLCYSSWWPLRGGGEVGKIRVGMGISTIKPLYYYFTKFNPFFS